MKTIKTPGPKEAQTRALREQKSPASAVKNLKVAAKKPQETKAKIVAKKPVSAQSVADFIARDAGASMEELVAKFRIDAHPMRAKIYNVRHVLGYAIKTKNGRYHGTPPKKKTA